MKTRRRRCRRRRCRRCRRNVASYLNSGEMGMKMEGGGGRGNKKRVLEKIEIELGNIYINLKGWGWGGAQSACSRERKIKREK